MTAFKYIHGGVCLQYWSSWARNCVELKDILCHIRCPQLAGGVAVV